MFSRNFLSTNENVKKSRMPRGHLVILACVLFFTFIPTSHAACKSFQAVPALIEAESYCYQNGFQIESTKDAKGSKNLSWTDRGDWATFNINVPKAGIYVIEMRVASPEEGKVARLEMGGGGATLADFELPSTGGLQKWTTVRKHVTLKAGQQTIALTAPTSGWNINWINITGAGISAVATNVD